MNPIVTTTQPTKSNKHNQKGTTMKVLCYPKCGMCRKAIKWLDENGVDYEYRHIVEENPTEDELREWHAKSGLPIKRMFNTSGMKYKELKLKDRIPEMSDDEIYELLATDGMLVKRPLLVDGDKVLVGFKEAEWEDLLK